jgi:hypothetical protein
VEDIPWLQSLVVREVRCKFQDKERTKAAQGGDALLLMKVYVVFVEETYAFSEPGSIEIVYSTKELAEQHCLKRNKDACEYVLEQWRKRNNKRPDEFPDEVLRPHYAYYFEDHDVEEVLKLEYD